MHDTSLSPKNQAIRSEFFSDMAQLDRDALMVICDGHEHLLPSEIALVRELTGGVVTDEDVRAALRDTP